MVSQRTKARVLGCIGAAALTMASTSVFAQSRDWQRGYDAGFRDGFAAGQNAGSGGVPPFQPPPAGNWQQGRLVVEEALFGIRGLTCDARWAVQSTVDRQGPNRIYASTQLCGDPAPNRAKTLWVTYRCDNRRPVSVSAPEGRWLNLNC